LTLTRPQFARGTFDRLLNPALPQPHLPLFLSPSTTQSNSLSRTIFVVNRPHLIFVATNQITLSPQPFQLVGETPIPLLFRHLLPLCSYLVCRSQPWLADATRCELLCSRSIICADSDGLVSNRISHCARLSALPLSPIEGHIPKSAFSCNMPPVTNHAHLERLAWNGRWIWQMSPGRVVWGLHGSWWHGCQTAQLYSIRILVDLQLGYILDLFH
jgi:hypothetical protein